MLLPVYSCLLSSDRNGQPLTFLDTSQMSLFSIVNTGCSPELPKKKKPTNKHSWYISIPGMASANYTHTVSRSPAFTSNRPRSSISEQISKRQLCSWLIHGRRSTYAPFVSTKLLNYRDMIFQWCPPRNSCVGKSKTKLEYTTPQATRANWTLNIRIDFNDENL